MCVRQDAFEEKNRKYKAKADIKGKCWDSEVMRCINYSCSSAKLYKKVLARTVTLFTDKREWNLNSRAPVNFKVVS